MHCYIHVRVEPGAQIFCLDPHKPEIEEIVDGSSSLALKRSAHFLIFDQVSLRQRY